MYIYAEYFVICDNLSRALLTVMFRLVRMALFRIFNAMFCNYNNRYHLYLT